jgi:hypothetical protein
MRRVEAAELPKEAIGHIQSAGCLGQKEVVTAAHNACIRELLQEVNVHGKADRHMKFLTIETGSRLSTLWDQEQRNVQKSSIKKDSGGGDWMELDWTQQLKSS